MKKIIYRVFIIIILMLMTSVIFLSTVGIETTKLNSQISNYVKNLKGELDIDLKKIKIFLNPINLSIEAKTVGAEIKHKKKLIEVNDIKTQISIKSLIRNDFSIKNLDISTKSLELNNLISFLRTFQNTTELFVLDKVIKKGYLIANINLEFDSNGKIKKNYKIKGFIKDTKIDLINKYNFEKLNFIFDYHKDNLTMKDLSFSLNDIDFFSKNINAIDNKNEFLISGNLENKDLNLSQNNLKIFVKPLFPFFEIKKIKFSSKNSFSFRLNNKFRVKNLEISSNVSINEFSIDNDFKLKKFFPKINKNISLINNDLKIFFKNNKLSIQGKGDILLQNENDYISYNVNRSNETLNFKTSLKLKNNPFKINPLNYEKKSDIETDIDFEGIFNNNKQTLIKSISLKEKNNIIKIDDLLFNDQFNIINVEKIYLDYIDKDNQKNFVKLTKKNQEYFIEGPLLNVNYLIDEILSDDNPENNVLNINNKLNIDIGKMYLDNEYYVENFSGFFTFKDKEILKANLVGNFSDNKNLTLTINTNDKEKITTLYTDKANPIVKRYKFIKGFDEGSLDFYSIKKLNTTNSTLKIYNFKLKELPILTKILTLASLQGIADILSGEGIRFDEFEMNFNKNGNLMKIDEIYAIGPAISILMDGYIEKNKLISLRGTLVPATTINKAIGSIPILGKILVGSKTGEGVFGVSFKIKGPPKKLETTVNPIKTLTPRFITRTLEKIKKN